MMDSETEDLLLQKLEEFIIDEDKIVSVCGQMFCYFPVCIVLLFR